MTDHIRIGLRVRALRRAKGLTQARLAEEADKSLDAISSLERGKYRSTVETLLGVARALDVPVSALLDGDRADNPKRARLLAALAAAGRTLSDADLEPPLSWSMRSAAGGSVSPEPPANMTDHIRIGLRVRALRGAVAFRVRDQPEVRATRPQ